MLSLPYVAQVPVSPNAPKSACPKCRRLHCTNPDHVRVPWQGSTHGRQTQRPEYAADRKRRDECVLLFLSESESVMLEDGRYVRCPDCHRWVKAERKAWVADHVQAVLFGGGEDGALRVHCATCSHRQGGRAANARRKV